MRTHIKRYPMPAHTYHVDATAGVDTQSGAADKPIQTITKINALALKPGDRVLFKAAEHWHGGVVAQSSGVPGRPISYASYGAGAKPILRGDNPVTGFTLHDGAIYRKTSYSPWFSVSGCVFQDGVRLTKAADHASLAQGTFFNDDAGNLDVWCTDDADPATHLIEATEVSSCVNPNGKGYLTFAGLDMERARLHGFNFEVVAGTHHVWITDCEANWSVRGFAQGSYTDWGLSYITFIGCTSHDTLEEGFWIGNGHNMVVRDCVAYNNGLDKSKGFVGLALGGTAFNFGIRADTVHVTRCHGYTGEDGTAVVNVENEAGYARPTGIILERCLFHGAAAMSAVVCDQGTNTVIRNCVIYDENAPCISLIDSGSGALIEHNTLRSNVAYGQVVYAAVASNVTFRWNVLHAPNANGRQLYVAAGGQSGWASYGNVFWGRQRYYWGSTQIDTLGEFATASGGDGDSVTDDPLFANEGIYDFHIGLGSPAINLAAASAVLEDYDGPAVRDDAGAFEYV